MYELKGAVSCYFSQTSEQLKHNILASMKPKHNAVVVLPMTIGRKTPKIKHKQLVVS